MGQAKITFYVDIISPFGYLAYWMLRNSPTFSTVQISYIPILLGGLHKQCGNLAPILVKNKDKWINKERQRWADQFNIPAREDPPPGFPVSTVNAMRALTALHAELNAASSREANEKFAEALDVLWAALWCPQSDVLASEDRKAVVDIARTSAGEFDIKNPESLKCLLAAVVGEEVAGRSVRRTAEKEVKDKLIANTGQAFERGAFGIPWFECENGGGEKEGFWGFDHFGQVVRFLGLDEAGDKGRSGQFLRAVL